MFQKFSKKAQSFLENSTDWLGGIFQTDFKEFGQEKVIELSENFNKAIPILQEAGFDLKEVSLNVGISPSILATLKIVRYLEATEEKIILDKYHDQKMIAWLLPPLYKARRMQSKVQFHGLSFNEMGIEIGLMPSVILRYQKAV